MFQKSTRLTPTLNTVRCGCSRSGCRRSRKTAAIQAQVGALADPAGAPGWQSHSSRAEPRAVELSEWRRECQAVVLVHGSSPGPAHGAADEVTDAGVVAVRGAFGQALSRCGR